MMRFIFILLFLSVLYSCRDEVAPFERPENLIPEDTLVMVLKDLMIMESHIELKYMQADKYKKTMLRSGDVIFNKYHVNSERFEASMDYFGSRQEEMQEIYSMVLDSLNRIGGTLKPEEKIKVMADTNKRRPGVVRPKRPNL